jgi:hypothetical protein
MTNNLSADLKNFDPDLPPDESQFAQVAKDFTHYDNEMLFIILITSNYSG